MIMSLNYLGKNAVDYNTPGRDLQTVAPILTLTTQLKFNNVSGWTEYGYN